MCGSAHLRGVQQSELGALRIDAEISGVAGAGVAFADPQVDGVRRTPAVRRRRLTLRRLTPWVAARDAALAPFR